MNRVPYALLACALLATGACGGRNEQHLVDGVFALRPDGLEVAFAIETPTTIECSIGLPTDTKATFTVARLLPAMQPNLVYVQEDLSRHAIVGPSSVTRVALKTPGAYVLRIPPIPTAMEFEARKIPVRVTAR